MRDGDLWERISNHVFDEAGVALPFSARLAYDMIWTKSFTLGAIQEYYRFVYLCCVSDTQLTPSEEVDEVWHLHLVYTRDYWEEFCPNVLGQWLHHSPTKGGHIERTKYQNAYQNTLWLYEQEFGTNPPINYWPQANVRFSSSNVIPRVDPAKHFIVPRRVVYSTVLAGAFGWLLFISIERDTFRWIALIVLAMLATGYIDRQIKLDKWPERGNNTGGCGGGCGGCGGCGG